MTNVRMRKKLLMSGQLPTPSKETKPEKEKAPPEQEAIVACS